MSNGYHQYCGLARALDAVGDRWNLLIVRELLIAPARYGELERALPGIASNLLAARLRHLTEFGIVRRVEGASAAHYELTEFGAGLREPIAAFGRWSAPLMVEGQRTDDHFRASWLILAIDAILGGRHLPAAETVVFEVNAERLAVEFPGGAPLISCPPRPGADAALTVRIDPTALIGFFAGAVTAGSVLDSAPGVAGDASVLERLERALGDARVAAA